MCLNTSTPMIYDPWLGCVVPYYNHSNNNNYINYHYQSNSSPSNNISVLNNQSGNHMNPNFITSQQSHNISYPLNSQNVSNGPVVKSEQDLYQRVNKNSSPQNYVKGYQTPKSNRVEQKTTPNSGSSSSEISVMSPDSPLYCENFPAMMGSNDRRNNRRETTPRSNSEFSDNQSRKHSHNKKRIKPTQLNKTAEYSGRPGTSIFCYPTF